MKRIAFSLLCMVFGAYSLCLHANLKFRLATSDREILAFALSPDGATLEDLNAASGWLPHTTRAAITRLRQRGYDVRLATMGTRKAYHLVPAG